MSKGAVIRRWMLLMLTVLLPVAAVVAYGWSRWGQLALEAAQVVMKLVVIP